MENNLYERYAKIRDLHGLTDYKVTNLSNIKGTATISNWKNGKYTPKDDKMQQIADVLEVSLDFLKGKTDIVVCPVCGFGNNPLSEQSRKEHENFHNKFLDIKRKYPFFMPFAEASIEKNNFISEFRNPQKTLESKLEIFEKYLKAAFSLEICKNDYNIDYLDYNQFCKVEVGNIEPDSTISQRLVDALVEKYGVDKEYLSGNEQLLARISKNETIMNVVRYAEKLSNSQLKTLEIQIKALAEQNERG